LAQNTLTISPCASVNPSECRTTRTERIVNDHAGAGHVKPALSTATTTQA
jgi:hypothetical protein